MRGRLRRVAAAEFGLGDIYFQGLGGSDKYRSGRHVLWQSSRARRSARPGRDRVHAFDRAAPVVGSKQAARLFRRAAEQGERRALYNLGLLYQQGEGVAKEH